MHTPTDYFRGTSREPESTSTLKASYGEYEALGRRHREVCSRIENLNEAMKLSRQRGAFQQLQTQMKEVKELVKEREDLDGKMAVADLARKKDDDHRLAVKQEVSYAERVGSVSERIAQLESLMLSFSEGPTGEFDFARCQRPDGSFYGTRGKCKKGTDAGAKVSKVPAEKVLQLGPREKVRQLGLGLKAAQKTAKVAERNAAAIRRKTKGDDSVEARRARITAEKAAREAELAAEKLEKAFMRAYDSLTRTLKRG